MSLHLFRSDWQATDGATPDTDPGTVSVVPGKRLHRLNLSPRLLWLCGIDAVLTFVSSYLSFCIYAHRCSLPHDVLILYTATLLPIIVARLTALYGVGVYRIVVHYTGLRDVALIGLATTCSSLAIALYLALVGIRSYPPTVLFVSWYLSFSFIAASRIGYRTAMQARQNWIHAAERQIRPCRMLIVGAGERGAALVRDLSVRSRRDLRLVGLLDDDVAKQDMMVAGVPVLGTLADVRRIVAARAVDIVVIAIGGASGRLIREITRSCDGLPVRYQIAPGLEWTQKTTPSAMLRDIRPEDLLQREPVAVDLNEISGYLSGERVLVTGGGGSIGSELVRQIVACRPAALLLLGHGENSLFEIEQEVRRNFGYNPTCLVADVRDYDRLLTLFHRHRPTVVFHAAAHKHVGLMESNPEEAVTNNVLGTSNLARIATLMGVRRFVLISTDKAVNPTSVMGMTKHVAERVIQAECRRSSTEFACVRFGNVLGSRGSVVPLMCKQIAQGGPVTVTHPEVERYFMTIPEAAQLVLQAGAMGGKGTIYLLEMGEPVRIIDMAKDLIRLSGKVPGKDIAIEITGLKPGEKLYEELLTKQEGAAVTHHRRILCAPPPSFAISDVDRTVETLIHLAQTGETEQLLLNLQHFCNPHIPMEQACVKAA